MYTTLFFSLVVVTFLSTIAVPILQIESEKKLPIPAWLPNENVSDFIFWQTYQFVSVATIILSLMGVTNECLFAAILAIVCEHLDILSNRFISIPEHIKSAINNKISALEAFDLEQRLIIKYIKEHQNIYS